MSKVDLRTDDYNVLFKTYTVNMFLQLQILQVNKANFLLCINLVEYSRGVTCGYLRTVSKCKCFIACTDTVKSLGVLLDSKSYVQSLADCFELRAPCSPDANEFITVELALYGIPITFTRLGTGAESATRCSLKETTMKRIRESSERWLSSLQLDVWGWPGVAVAGTSQRAPASATTLCLQTRYLASQHAA
ncbi:hypothetical protein J6590_017410 [Homalodisca vitripennis]|nr:hypothetical protein J6590_017410 [Homalodisca vitripennis]